MRTNPLPLACVLTAALTLPLGCGAPAAPPAGPPDASYAVRGEIRQLPRPEGNEILIRHEAVPDLKDSSGKVVGMASMTMPFALGADVDRSRLAVGDRISFTLEVRWNAGDPITVTKLAPLAPGTRLDFDPPDAGDDGAPAASQPAVSGAETPR